MPLRCVRDDALPFISAGQRVVRTVLVGALGLASTVAMAAPSDIEGSWRGSGFVSYAGQKERVTCRATYSHVSGKSYELSATCAAPSGSLSQSATVRYVGGNRYRGEIYSD